MTEKELISLGISIIAICLSIFNFIVNYRFKIRTKKIQVRNDKIEIDNLLDKAYDCLYGKEGFQTTKEREKFYEAESAILRAKEIDKSYSRVIEYEGMCLELMGKKDKAIQKYKEALKLKPIRWNSYNMLGRLHSGDEAISYFKDAIKINPDKAGLPYYNIGRELKKMNKLKEARDSLMKSLEFLPNYQYTHFELAGILEKEGKYKEARLSFEKAISSNPKYIDAIVSLGAMLCEKEDWDEGVAWIEQAMKIDPSESYPYAMLAALYADKEDPDNALKFNEKAVELDPTRRISDDVSQDLKKAMLKLKNTQNNN